MRLHFFGYKKPMTPLSRAASLLTLCATLLSLSCESVPQDKAAAIARANYPGKREVDQCGPYADALFKALQDANIEAWKITYMGGAWEGHYQHALVVYKDAGAYWYVDNMFPYPTRTSGTTPRQWVMDRDPQLNVILRVETTRPLPDATPQPAAQPQRAVLTGPGLPAR